MLLAADPIADWVPLLINASFSGVVAWYLLSKAIPDMQKRFSEDLQSARDDARKAIENEKAALDKVLQLVINSKNETLFEKLDRIADGQEELRALISRKPLKKFDPSDAN